MTILARAYREDGFPHARLPPSADEHGGERMRQVEREEILDYVTYERAARRDPAPRPWRPRPRGASTWASTSPSCSRTRDTVRYQVQEMVRAEQIVQEADIQHELDTYNELLGGAGRAGLHAAHRDRRRRPSAP